MKTSNGPQFLRFIIPIIEILQNLGGSGAASDITDSVIEKMRITESELNEKLKNGSSRVRNQIAWARMYLVNAGLMASSVRGLWKLTDKGLAARLDRGKVLTLFKEVQSTFKNQAAGGSVSKTKPKQEEFEVEVPHEGYKSELLTILRGMSPTGFEKIVRRLLSELGLRQVEVTGRTGDRGIDGIGLLEVNELVKFKVFFQCKKFDSSVGSPSVRDFRGALSGRAVKGIFLTTGYFTPEASKEANRDGVEPIELVDGERLIERFEKYTLGLASKTIYEIDHEFFSHFQ